MQRVLVAVSLAFLVCTLPAAANGTFILGGVVAEAAGENEETGLVDISGAHSAVWDVELPWATDLVVYLRWEGAGEHVLGLQLVDDMDSETLAELERDVDLGDYSTTFTIDELSNVIFERPGMYDVLVSLDDEVVFALPYLVNADEWDIPEDVFLLASLPAVDGWLEADGNGEVEGAFEHFVFQKFPASDDFAVVNLWFSGDGIWDEHAEIRDSRGAVIARSEPQALEGYPGELTVLTDYFDNVLFRSEGDYEVAIYLDDEEVCTYLLRVLRGE